MIIRILVLLAIVTFLRHAAKSEYNDPQCNGKQVQLLTKKLYIYIYIYYKLINVQIKMFFYALTWVGYCTFIWMAMGCDWEGVRGIFRSKWLLRSTGFASPGTYTRRCMVDTLPTSVIQTGVAIWKQRPGQCSCARNTCPQIYAICLIALQSLSSIC